MHTFAALTPFLKVNSDEGHTCRGLHGEVCHFLTFSIWYRTTSNQEDTMHLELGSHIINVGRCGRQVTDRSIQFLLVVNTLPRFNEGCTFHCSIRCKQGLQCKVGCKVKDCARCQVLNCHLELWRCRLS